MATPYLVACLVQLRDEFNQLEPARDKGADGWIGDAVHLSRTSDHNPDPAGRVLAVDIDSTGPWTDAEFDDLVQLVVARQRAGADDRLEYVIWDRQITSRSSSWTWRAYTGSSDPHTGHAHFSARHDHIGNTSTAPWYLEEAMLTSATIEKIADAVTANLLGQKLGSSGPIVGVALQSGYRNSVAAVDLIGEVKEVVTKPES